MRSAFAKIGSLSTWAIIWMRLRRIRTDVNFLLENGAQMEVNQFEKAVKLIRIEAYRVLRALG